MVDALFMDLKKYYFSFSEQEVIWFLQSCYFSNESAKISIDNYFTMKTMSPELFKKRDKNSEIFNANMKLG